MDKDGETRPSRGISQQDNTLIYNVTDKDVELEPSRSTPQQGTLAKQSFDLSSHCSIKQTPDDRVSHFLERLSSKLSKVWVESVGIRPLTIEERTNTKWWNVSLVWFSANVNVLSFSTGTLVPSLGLDYKAAMLTILFFGAFCSLFPAYFSLFGAQLGIRQMVHARYSFGYVGTSIVCLLNAATMLGYCILNTIVGGLTLSTVSSRPDGSSTLSPVFGIVIATVISLVVSFSGIRILHLFERWLWLPVMICFLILIGEAGTGPQGLHVPVNQPKPTAKAVLTLASILAGYIISYSALVSDVSHYLKPDISKTKLFISVYLGFFLSCVPFIMIGAAFGCSSIDNPEWSQALAVSSGRFFNLILVGKLGNFGKFVQVILALSIVGNISATIYSLGLTFQTMIPYLVTIPRFVWPLLANAIFLPLSIVGHSKFYTTLSNFTSVLGYWSSLYIGIVLIDHIVIRQKRFESYQISIWNQSKKLPSGIAAISACIVSLALVIPCIDQVWFVGPIAKKTGDIAFEVGLVISMLLYIPFRLFEKRVMGR